MCESDYFQKVLLFSNGSNISSMNAHLNCYIIWKAIETVLHIYFSV